MADDEYISRNEHNAFASDVEHMLVNQTEQNKRLEELENRDGEKWRSISMYVLTALIGAVIGFVLKQAGL